MGAKDIIRSMPLVGSAVGRLRQVVVNRLSPFTESSSYWESRYKAGGNSGAGSYDRLAEFKAQVLNRFVADNGIKSVLELGSGDGAQLALAEYPRYYGVDVSPTALELCRAKFGDDPTKEFILLEELPGELTADLALSLDVIYHLVEDDIFEAHMATLFDHADRNVIIYASNYDAKHPVPHVRHRQFSRWVEANRPDWRLATTIPNAYPYDPKRPYETSFADFYVYEKAVG
jgi:SAM-dependent methyltransferase